MLVSSVPLSALLPANFPLQSQSSTSAQTIPRCSRHSSSAIRMVSSPSKLLLVLTRYVGSYYYATARLRKEEKLMRCTRAQMVALSAAQGYAQVCGKPAAVIVHVVSSIKYFALPSRCSESSLSCPAQDCGTQVHIAPPPAQWFLLG